MSGLRPAARETSPSAGRSSAVSAGIWSVTPTSLPIVDFDAHRLSFGPAAQLYDRIRPSYPRTAIEWALGGTPLRVLDLGAGTGLLTRSVLRAGHEVLPVEPDAGMREQLDATTPGVTALAGSAEQIPLPDASVDAVVAGQAYHWFDPERAHPEIARVLKPGGILAPMWNERETSQEWTAKLEEIMGQHRGRWIDENVADFGPLFTEITEREFPHAVSQSPQGLCDLVASRSYFLVSTPQRQAEILAQILRLCEEELPGQENFEMGYVTHVKKSFKR
jgi:SAM-dependent methyltransferase